MGGEGIIVTLEFMSREEGIGSGVQVEGSFFQRRRRVTSVEIRKRRGNGTDSGRFILLIMRGREISSFGFRFL